MTEADPLATSTRLEEQLLGGPRTVTLCQMAERVGVGLDEVRSFWHDLGLPTVAPEVAAYTEQDVHVVRCAFEAARRYELGPTTATSLVRSVGHTADRLVVWQVEALVEHTAARYGLDDASARLVVLDRLSDIAPLLEQQMVHAWRRQLAAIAGRTSVELVATRIPASVPGELPLARAIGFADIVAFTSRTAALRPTELADFVQAFELRARDVITAGGARVVKTIGDAVLFVADDVVIGARVALGLAEELTAKSGPVRVGLVWGRVLSRFGDVFGPSVNLAARLTDEAEPGTVLLDADTAALLLSQQDDTGGEMLRFEEQPVRDIPGVGRLRPVRLARQPA